MFDAPEWLWWVMLVSPLVLTPIIANAALARAPTRPGLGRMMAIGMIGAVPLALFLAATRPEGGLGGAIGFVVVLLLAFGCTIGLGLVNYVEWLRREDAKRRPPEPDLSGTE